MIYMPITVWCPQGKKYKMLYKKSMTLKEVGSKNYVVNQYLRCRVIDERYIEACNPMKEQRYDFRWTTPSCCSYWQITSYAEGI